MPDYAKGQIYIIRNHTDDRVYIGSTTQTLAQRMTMHRSAAKVNPHYKLYEAFRELGVDRFYVERLEEFPCGDKTALNTREGYYVRLHDSVNKGLNGVIPGRTSCEYQRDQRKNNPEYRERQKNHQRAFYERHPEKLEETKEKQKQRWHDRYHNDEEFRKQHAEKSREKRLNNPALRERNLQSCHNRWINLTEEQRETQRQLRRERYRNDPEYHKRQRMSNLKYKQSLKSRESPPDSA